MAQTPMQACVVEYWQAQNRMPYPLSGIGKRLGQVTHEFWDGPWPKAAFDQGWTKEQIFGIAYTDEPSPGYQHKWSLGLVPQLALGIFKAILSIEGDIAEALYMEYRKPTTFAFNRNDMDWSKAIPWWDCNVETLNDIPLSRLFPGPKA